MPPARTIAFRPASYSDAAFAAEAHTATDPLHPRQAAEILERWTNTEQGAAVRRYVIQVDGIDFGWMSLVKPQDSAGDAAWLNVIVPGDDEAVIEAAIAYTEEQARELPAAMLISAAWESQTAAIRVLRRMGWEQQRQQRFWRLELAPNAARLADLRAAARHRVESQGLRLASVAELGGEALYPALHAVSEATGPDVPSTVPYTPEPYAGWVAWMHSPFVFQDRIWVAIADDRPVGYSYLAYRPSLVETGYTGVLREQRGKGVARALKLETLVQASDLGVEAVETDNDFENAPILHLNQELGYHLLASKLEFEKQL